VLQTSAATICVIGEGEETIVELLAALEQGKRLHGVAGIAFRNGDEIVRTPRRKRMANLDDLPLPAWDLFPMEEYRARKQNSGLYQGRAMRCWRREVVRIAAPSAPARNVDHAVRHARSGEGGG